MNFNKGVGMTTNIKVVERPVTHQGVPGIKPKGQSHTRQIYDRSYYVTQMNKKNKELMIETNKFRKEIDELGKDNQIFLQLEKRYCFFYKKNTFFKQKRYEELNKEVRNLEGRLADYNLAADKQRANTRPEDMRLIYEHIKVSK